MREPIALADERDTPQRREVFSFASMLQIAITFCQVSVRPNGRIVLVDGVFHYAKPEVAGFMHLSIDDGIEWIDVARGLKAAFAWQSDFPN